MGDADAPQRSEPALQIENVTEVLDALDEDLTLLHATVQDLERRTVNAVTAQLKGYVDFRRFFLAMNFLILPITIAMAICYSMKEMLLSEVSQAALHTAVMILLYLSGSLGVPLYLGALWAIYKFAVPLETPQGEFLNQPFVNLDDFDLVERDSDIRPSEDNFSTLPVNDVDADEMDMPASTSERKSESAEVVPDVEVTESDLPIYSLSELW